MSRESSRKTATEARPQEDSHCAGSEVRANTAYLKHRNDCALGRDPRRNTVTEGSRTSQDMAVGFLSLPHSEMGVHRIFEGLTRLSPGNVLREESLMKLYVLRCFEKAKKSTEDDGEVDEGL